MSQGTLAVLAFVAIMLLGRLVAQRQRHAPGSQLAQSRSALRDWTAVVSALATAVALTLPILEGVLRSGPVTSLPFAASGLLVIGLGWAVAYFANREIGRNWSPVIDKSSEQELTTSGVYALVRHPLYPAGLLVVAGANIYFRGTWAWIGLVVVVVAVLLRIPQEERRLVEQFGKAYVAYQRRAKALVPWIV